MTDENPSAHFSPPNTTTAHIRSSSTSGSSGCVEGTRRGEVSLYIAEQMISRRTGLHRRGHACCKLPQLRQVAPAGDRRGNGLRHHLRHKREARARRRGLEPRKRVDRVGGGRLRLRARALGRGGRGRERRRDHVLQGAGPGHVRDRRGDVGRRERAARVARARLQHRRNFLLV